MRVTEPHADGVDVDVIVVGNGLIGAATARHLADAGHEVALIGPGEPEDHSTHRGPFASHYDEGRLVSAVGRDPIWASLARRSIDSFASNRSQADLMIRARGSWFL